MVSLSKLQGITRMVLMGSFVMLSVGFFLMVIFQTPPSLETMAIGVWYMGIGGGVASLIIRISLLGV